MMPPRPDLDADLILAIARGAVAERFGATTMQIPERPWLHERAATFVTINRGTIKGGGWTTIGHENLLMACCHVAHDCEIDDHVILANNVLLAGHVKVGRRANISGGTGAHHFVTVGAYAYVGGMTRMVQDVPPFMILEGHPSRVRGVNVVGLERAGKSPDSIAALREVYKRVYRNRESAEPRKRLLERLESEYAGQSEVLEFVQALRDTELGPKGRYRETLREEFARLGRERILGGART